MNSKLLIFVLAVALVDSALGGSSTETEAPTSVTHPIASSGTTGNPAPGYTGTGTSAQQLVDVSTTLGPLDNETTTVTTPIPPTTAGAIPSINNMNVILLALSSLIVYALF